MSSTKSKLLKHVWRNVVISGSLVVRCDRCKEIYAIKYMSVSKVYCYAKPSQ